MKALRILLPLVVFIVAVAVSWWIIASKPEPRQREFKAQLPKVEVLNLVPTDYQVVLDSQGTVRARTSSNLIPEVRGRVLEISPKFREGGWFEKGDMLLQIDPHEYRTEVVIAKANLAQMELDLAEEEARAEQAVLDWKRLENGDVPNDLVLRNPQLKRAQAFVDSAKARLETAERNLKLTKIIAPYEGRVLSQNVDVGQYVTPGTQLARIYAVDFAEVRMPLTETQLSFLDLPEIYQGEPSNISDGPNVVFSSTIAGKTYEWSGRVVRAAGSFDPLTRQLFVIAQVRNPYQRSHDDRPPLKSGSFVRAKIRGKTLENVFEIPRKLLRENSFLLTVDRENRLRRKTVNIVWQNDESIIVDEGLKKGERICLTDVPFAVEGLPVAIRGAPGSAEPERKPRRKAQTNDPSS